MRQLLLYLASAPTHSAGTLSDKHNTLFSVLGGLAQKYLRALPVVFPRVAPTLQRREPYSRFATDVALCLMSIDSAARGARQAEIRSSNAIARIGTLLTHIVAVLTDCPCT